MPTWLMRLSMTPSSRTPASVPEHGAGAAGQQRAADDDRGDRLELQADADGGEARRRTRGHEHAGERGQEGAHDVDGDLDPGDGQAHQPGRLLAATDGRHREPVPGALEHDPADEEREPGDPDGPPDAEELALAQLPEPQVVAR